MNKSGYISDAGKEVETLPFAKIAQIAMKGIRIRIWRSLLVVSCIILAVAFLTYILGADTFQRNLPQSGSEELIEKLVRTGAYDPDNLHNQRIQTYWMVGLAIMISFVGIVNAMLMSVTERFREIGTMKCLGALDSFVLKLFLIESAVVGAAGTISGIVVGCLLFYLEGLYVYGGEVQQLLSFKDLGTIVPICLMTGILITVIGALYPAYRAAKMKPVVALRAEI